MVTRIQNGLSFGNIKAFSINLYCVIDSVKKTLFRPIKSEGNSSGKKPPNFFILCYSFKPFYIL